VCCRILSVSAPGYYKYRRRTASASALRRTWLSGLIREIHVTSAGTYGARRIHDELTIHMGIRVSESQVSRLMRSAGLQGIPGPVRVKQLRATGGTGQYR
jgi:putative transposase